MNFETNAKLSKKIHFKNCKQKNISSAAEEKFSPNKRDVNIDMISTAVKMNPASGLGPVL